MFRRYVAGARYLKDRRPRCVNKISSGKDSSDEWTEYKLR